MNPVINPVIVRFLLVTAAFFGLAALAIDAASAEDVAPTKVVSCSSASVGH